MLFRWFNLCIFYINSIISNIKHYIFPIIVHSNKQEHVFINSSFTDVFDSVSSIYVINEHNTLHNVQPDIHECIIMKESSYESNDITSIDNSLTFNGKEY